MDKTFIITDNDFYTQAKAISNELSIEIIPLPLYQNDAEIHDWTTREFNSKEIEKIIIPLSLPSNEMNTEGLLLAMHIRLNYELPLKKRLISIVFLSNLSLNNIIQKSVFNTDNNPQELIFSQGVSFSSTDIDDIRDTIFHSSSIAETEYVSFLNNLNIKPKAEVGNHSIANVWGAYVMSIMCNKVSIFEDKMYQDKVKSMYFKYVLAKRFSTIMMADANKKNEYVPINSFGHKILLIDDEAEKCGWDKVIKGLFLDEGKSVDVIHEQVKDFDSFSDEAKRMIKSGDYDLFLLDLRLNGSMEEDIYETKKFSGFNVLDKIRNENAGNQVIIFSASNKAWNLKVLLERGASGYYIKESPEFFFTEKFTQANFNSFRKDIEKCFENAYLKEIYISKDAISKHIQKKPFAKYSSRNKNTEKYHQLINLEAGACFNILKTNNPNRFFHAMLMMYKIVEYVDSIFFDGKKVINNYFNIDFYYKGNWYATNDIVKGRIIDGELKEKIDDRDLYSTKNKCYNIMKNICLLQSEDNISLYEEIDELSRDRNMYIHGSEQPNITTKKLTKWFKNVATIINNL